MIVSQCLGYVFRPISGRFLISEEKIWKQSLNRLQKKDSGRFEDKLERTLKPDSAVLCFHVICFRHSSKSGIVKNQNSVVIYKIS